MSQEPSSSTSSRYAIVIHGGAGINAAKLSPEKRQRIEDSLTRILQQGKDRLAKGEAALEVVEQTIRLLEDDPLFNAGRGAVFNSDGGHELDASIMDGKSLKCGAVAGLRIVKNPISLARLVMQETPHVLLAGDGAEVFATQMQKKFSQIEIVENSYFSTDEQYEEWQRKRAKQDQPIQESGGKKGTVGCVVLDTHGDIVAGTSTGGLTNKKFGRVGDSPIIGAGTYANNKTCGVSCTGTGEYFIRHSIAFQINALMDFKQASLDEAVRHVIFNVLPDDIGGLIAIDHQGNISMHTNTPGMSRGAADSSGRFEVKIARDP